MNDMDGGCFLGYARGSSRYFCAFQDSKYINLNTFLKKYASWHQTAVKSMVLAVVRGLILVL